MENSLESSYSLNPTNTVVNEEESMFSGKNLIIVILSFVLILSFLGINLLQMLGDLVQTISNLVGPLFVQILSIFGYTAGTVIDKSGDVVTDVTKKGVDIAGDTVQSVADLLKDASRGNVNQKALSTLDGNIDKSKKDLDKDINEGSKEKDIPEPDNSVDPIQKPISSGKKMWCLVGEYQGKRGCVEVDEIGKCLSGQVFPNQKVCLNPTQTIYRHSAYYGAQQ